MSKAGGLLGDELLRCYKEGKRARLEKGKAAGSKPGKRVCSSAVDIIDPEAQGIDVGAFQTSVFENGQDKSTNQKHLASQAESTVDCRVSAKLTLPVETLDTKPLDGCKFYGKRSKSKQWAALLKQIATANRNFILAEEEAKRQRLARSALWQVFPTQEMAFKFADAHGAKTKEDDHPVILTYEDPSTGRRRFLVTTLDVFWHRYQRMLPGRQHYYEIIREGYPCHLYLDLEYLKEPNPGADPEAIMAAVLALLEGALQEHLGVALQQDALMELDSSTDDKFSRHLIVPIPGHAFASNAHAGALVKKLCSCMRARRDSDTACALLFVHKAGEEASSRASSLVIDEAVYSRNRAFRLPFSCKYGKTARLLPTPRFKAKNLADREVFFASLICPPGGFPGAALLNLPAVGAGLRKPPAAGTVVKASRVCEPSPFPAVDDFIQHIASVDDTPARLRNWTLFPERGVLVYNIDHNRYCERIDRQHKSNNVMYVVDFLLAGYYQKCHDPECRDYRFTIRPLPAHLLPEAHRPPLAIEPQSRVGKRGAAGQDDMQLDARLVAHGQRQDAMPLQPPLQVDNEAPAEWWEKVGEIASAMKDFETWEMEPSKNG